MYRIPWGLALLLAFSPLASGQNLEVVGVTQQQLEGPITSGHLQHALPNSAVFRMRVKNLRGPLGNICADWLWFDASGLLEGAVSCQSAPGSGPDIREFVAVIAPAPPDDAELRIAFRHRTFSRFGERISFRGAPERRAPALFSASQTAFACDNRADLEYVAATADDPETRALLFRMTEIGRCSIWAAGTLVDILGVRGDFALARAAGDGVNVMWTLRSFLE